MPFTQDQQRAIDLRGTNILVSASAGSGKTSVLVERLCQLVIKDQISIDHILAMTFTKAAAAEMKERLRQKLLEQEQSDYIRNQLALLETAQISTIDSFCLSIVQNYYYQIPISLKMANSNLSDSQQKQAFDKAYQAAKEKTQTPELNEYIWGLRMKDEDVKKAIEDAIALAWSKPDPIDWLENQNNDQTEIWFLRYFHQHIQAIIDICSACIIFDVRFQEKIDLLQPLLDMDYDHMRSGFLIYFEKTGYFRHLKKSTQCDPDTFKGYANAIKEHEQAIAKYLFKEYIDTTKLILREFSELVIATQEEYANIKQSLEMIDFSDMETFAHQLLKNPIIQEEVRNQYDMILVDEFQDTNDLQESIICQIERGNNVFRVGDVKQSIYGFRHARPEIMKNHMKSDADELIVMDKNFRSNANIIQFNNDFYEKIMNGSLLGTQFEQVDVAYTGASYQTQNQQHPIRFLYTTYDKSNQKAMNANRFDIMAHDILKQHKNGRAFRDICILTRGNNAQQDIKEALEAYGIPVYVNAKKGFYQVPAVQIVLATLSAIYDPFDDVHLTASLFSPIGQVNSEQLAKACMNKKRGSHLFSHIKDQSFMNEWLSLYQQSHDTPTQWLESIYQFHDFYMNHTTAQEKTNLDALMEKSLDYDTLADFIESIQKDAKNDSVGVASAFSKQDDVVQIITMHGSKGLQFPLVYILSKNKESGGKQPEFLMDSDLGIGCFSMNNQTKRMSKKYLAISCKQALDSIKEEMRIFYVATTRAQQELVFVDNVAGLDAYIGPLTTHALLKNQSYTGWLMHTYWDDPHSPVHFVKMPLYIRPEKKDPLEKHVHRKTYHQESSSIQSSTASSAKRVLAWQPFDLTPKQNTVRGTLFHEIMQCHYPFQPEDMKVVAKKYGYELSDTDIDQLQQLNQNEIYAKWMREKHDFECSYIVRKENQITHGFMDLVVWEKDKTIIVDYKTDHATREELIDKYHKQLEMYKDALATMDASKPIEMYIYSFHLGILIQL